MIRAIFNTAFAGKTEGVAPARAADPHGKGFQAWSDGILAGTLIATGSGWTRAENLSPGDQIVTFDHGLRPLRAVSLARLTTTTGARLPQAAQPLAVPAGALNNRQALTLLPGQAVLIESDTAEQRLGDPFALVPASALHGFRGIARIEHATEFEVVMLAFENDEIVYAEGMTLLHCPRRHQAMVTTPDELIRAGGERHYPLLPPTLGQSLLSGMAPA